VAKCLAQALNHFLEICQGAPFCTTAPYWDVAHRHLVQLLTSSYLVARKLFCSHSTYDLEMLLELIVGSIGAYTAWSFFCMELNYMQTLSMGVPLIRLPVDPLNMPIQIIEPLIFTIVDVLPSWLIPNCIWYLRRG
jgi:hypothetical protein